MVQNDSTYVAIECNHNCFSYSCRPVQEPFLYGMIVPWALLHALLWVAFIFLPCPCFSYTMKEHLKRSWLREYIGLVVAILLFDVGWGLGLPATHPLHLGSLRFYSQIIFSATNGLIGPVFLVFYCLLNKSVRNVCIWLSGKLKRRALQNEDWQLQSGLYDNFKKIDEEENVRRVDFEEEKDPPQITFEYNLDEVYGNPAALPPDETYAIMAETEFK